MDLMKLSLASQYNTISVEAFAGPEALQSALTRLPSFFKDVTRNLTNAFKVPFTAVFVGKDLHWAEHAIAKFAWHEIKDEPMPCVPGLEVDYLTYTKALHDAAVFCSDVRVSYIEPLINYLAKKLANQQALQSNVPDQALAAISLEPVDKLNQLVSALIDPKRDTSEMPYGKLFRRHADWKDVVDHARGIHLAFAKEDHARFERSLERANELIGTLIARMQPKSGDYEMSAQTVETVSRAAYAAATAVEFYGLTYYRARALEVALDKLVDAVKAL